MMPQKLFISFLMVLLSVGMHAQSISPFVIASSGGEGSSGDMSIEWTLGEMMVETFTADDIVLTQGFHQPHLIVTSIDEMPGHDISIDAYPNPTSDFINIRLHDDKYHDMEYNLFNEQGRLIRSGRLEGLITEISLNEQQNGVYFVIITTGREEVKTFKVVKNR